MFNVHVIFVSNDWPLNSDFVVSTSLFPLHAAFVTRSNVVPLNSSGALVSVPSRLKGVLNSPI